MIYMILGDKRKENWMHQRDLGWVQCWQASKSLGFLCTGRGSQRICKYLNCNGTSVMRKFDT